MAGGRRSRGVVPWIQCDRGPPWPDDDRVGLSRDEAEAHLGGLGSGGTDAGRFRQAWQRRQCHPGGRPADDELDRDIDLRNGALDSIVRGQLERAWRERVHASIVARGSKKPARVGEPSGSRFAQGSRRAVLDGRQRSLGRTIGPMLRAISLPPARSVAAGFLIAAASIALASVAVSMLERFAGVPNASPIYLVAVVVVALQAGTVAAATTAVGAFLVYNYLFVDPRHTFAVADPGEWLNLLLLLFVGIVVGRLTAAQRARAEAAGAREREARALFRLSRTMALAPSSEDALPEVLAILVAETQFSRVWVTLGAGEAGDRIAADSLPGSPPATPAVVAVLHRRPGDEPAEWSLVHHPRGTSRSRGSEDLAHRVAIETPVRRLGSLWALRQRDAGPPAREETRLLSAAADHVGQALEHDQLAAEAVSAEVARRSDRVKSALLDSVSHDLRTPLASIRAAAGSLIDPALSWTPDEVRASAETIDQEADRLARLVTALLDLSRIEAGELRAELRPLVLAEAVRDAVARLAVRLGGRPVEVDVPDDLPLVLVDEVFLEQTIANVVENIALHTPPDVRVLLRARAVGEPLRVRLEIADGGPGVPPAAMARLFDKFYRVERPGAGARRGSGIGLAIARGLIEAMGGTIEASPSELGGLSISIELPTVAAQPAEHVVEMPAGPLAAGSS